MTEKRVVWSRPAAIKEGEVRGAMTAARYMIEHEMPRDGEWHRCIVPWAGRNSSGASQAKIKLEIYYPDFEFRTFNKRGLRYVEARYKKADDE